jgi:hypothetical protein
MWNYSASIRSEVRGQIAEVKNAKSEVKSQIEEVNTIHPTEPVFTSAI